MTDHSMTEKWQQAYLEQNHDATVGRLFDGLIHNMNGVLQTFAMQTDLFGLMFSQADGMLQQLAAAAPDGVAAEQAAQLRVLMERHADLVRHMVDKVQLGRSIMQGVQRLDGQNTMIGMEPYTVNSIIRIEMDLYSADMFFKHKVSKDVRLATEMPVVKTNLVALHGIISVLLANAIEAMRDFSPEPRLIVETGLQDGRIRFAMTDNGCGIAPENLPRIRQPFFSTKEGRHGLGLFLAESLLKQLGGSLSCTSAPGATCFECSFPEEKV